MTSRQSKVKVEVESLEHNMELLCLTGVEDKLQAHVKPTLEMLSNAGIKVNAFLFSCLLLLNYFNLFVLDIFS